MQTAYHYLYSASSYFNEFDDLGLFALRLAIAAIFLIHGISKFGMWKMKPSNETPTATIMMMRFLSITEALGALAILFGFLTQFAAIGLAIIMLGAIYFKIRKWKISFTSQATTGWEFDLMILAGCIALVTFGAGGISIDKMFLGL